MAADELVPVPTTTTEVQVHPDSAGFKEKVQPKSHEGKVFLFKCPKELVKVPTLERAVEGAEVEKEKCNNVHFRHAGYVKNVIPIMRTAQLREIIFDSVIVMVCTKCRSCYMHVDGQAYDVTQHIDLEAWAKTEEAMHKALGPGGMDC